MISRIILSWRFIVVKIDILSLWFSVIVLWIAIKVSSIHDDFQNESLVLHWLSEMHQSQPWQMDVCKRTSINIAVSRGYIDLASLPWSHTNLNLVNASRAVRIFEIISDFRELQISIRQTQIGSDNSDSSLLGYEIYEECIREAGSILALPYINESQMDIEEEGDGEIQKLQLQSYLAIAAYHSTHL